MNRRQIVSGGLAVGLITVLPARVEAQAGLARGSIRNLVDVALPDAFSGRFRDDDVDAILRNIDRLASNVCGYPRIVRDHIENEWADRGRLDRRHLRSCPVCYGLLVAALHGVMNHNDRRFPGRDLSFSIQYAEGRDLADECGYFNELGIFVFEDGGTNNAVYRSGDLAPIPEMH